MVHTAMYDAWSVYDNCSISTTTALLVKAHEKHCSKDNRRKAFSYAAYRVLNELFLLALPAEKKHIFRDKMVDLGYNPEDTSLNIETPQGIGNLAATMTIEYRNGDGSNPLGTLHMPAWSDYTGYHSVNTPDKVNDVNRWQPLRNEVCPGEYKVQTFLTPHWGLVRPFALSFNWQYRPAAPFKKGEQEFTDQAQEVLDISACLSDEQKAIAEYWADGPGTFSPAGHWCEVAQFIAMKNDYHNSQCIKLLFALGNALLDASIAAWECKRHYDSVRPITAIHELFRGLEVQAWAGPHKDTKTIRGENWKPYIPTPPFAAHVSAHSTLARAAASVLKQFTGSDAFGGCTTIEKGASAIENGHSPCVQVTLDWPTFTAAAEQAGMSRLYGGVQFARGNNLGQKLGAYIGTRAWEKALFYFNEEK